MAEGIRCHAFRTQPRDQLFNKAFPFFRIPEEYGYFSQDSRRQFRSDRSQIRFYVPPANINRVNYDLTHGWSNFIRKDEDKKEYLDDLIKWVVENKMKFQIKTTKTKDADQDTQSQSITSLNTDFVCWRGLLTRLLCTQYESRDGWIIAVTLFKGTYYLCEFETEEKKHQRDTTTERQDQICYGGWKFEQYLTSDVEGGSPDTSVPVNNNEGFCSVVRTRLNKHSLVFGGEVDCVDPTLSSKNKYVELKTSREMDNPRQRENFHRYKLIKWWAQSFLVGIEKIICGFRDDDGIVHRLEEFPTLKIPDMVKGIRNPWNAAVCFNFLDKFLDFVKQTVTTDDPRVVYVCRWQPRQDVNCEKMAPNSEFVFLPDWFTHDEVWG
ncbi:decapping and exoribonuclease protein-like [Haliotis rufescens]|uniref:decapping and exoribonuclease protein-like n=1 Tax=Haliotis rufescens TaxID=6454 RepID=UPI00201EFAAC|nr:decapping and exoribonuclease protein-like [Haliotis rufescens]